MTLLHSYPVGTRVELNLLGRECLGRRARHWSTGTVVGQGREENRIRVLRDYTRRPVTTPARYWRPLTR